MPDSGAKLPALPFSAMRPGREFEPQEYSITAELVREFSLLTGDDNPIYRDPIAARAAGLPGPVAPPGLAGVWARRSYLARHRMLPGGVMAGQDLEFHRAALVGSVVTLGARVLEQEPEDPARRVLLECTARDSDSGLVGAVRIDARWPKGDG